VKLLSEEVTKKTIYIMRVYGNLLRRGVGAEETRRTGRIGRTRRTGRTRETRETILITNS